MDDAAVNSFMRFAAMFLSVVEPVQVCFGEAGYVYSVLVGAIAQFRRGSKIVCRTYPICVLEKMRVVSASFSSIASPHGSFRSVSTSDGSENLVWRSDGAGAGSDSVSSSPMVGLPNPGVPGGLMIPGIRSAGCSSQWCRIPIVVAIRTHLLDTTDESDIAVGSWPCVCPQRLDRCVSSFRTFSCRR
jgi:hypothetical protein